jgi:hypothetical protein
MVGLDMQHVTAHAAVESAINGLATYRHNSDMMLDGATPDSPGLKSSQLGGGKSTHSSRRLAA